MRIRIPTDLVRKQTFLLPTKFAVATVLCGLVVALVGNFYASGIIRNQVNDKLELVAERGAIDVQSFLEDHKRQLAVQATDPTVIAATRNFGLTIKNLSGDPLTQLRQSYAKPLDDGKPAIERVKAGSTTYDRMHEQYHPGFVSMMKFGSLADVYLIDPSGQVIYSVTKGEDYAVNIKLGKWATQRLSVLATALAAQQKPEVLVSDVETYVGVGPSLFMAAPVLYYGKNIGTIAYRIDAIAIQNAIKTHSGLGETGEIRIVRRDGTMLSDSRYTAKIDLLGEKLVLPAEAAKSEDIARFDFDDPLSRAARVAVAAPIKGVGNNWLVLTSQTDAEVFEPLVELRNSLLLTLAVFLIIGSIVGVAVARSILSPMQLLNSAMTRLARGQFGEDTPGQARRDELGAMAQAVEVLRAAALEKARLEQQSEEIRASTEQNRADNERARAVEEDGIRKAVDALRNGLQRLSEGDLTVELDQPFMESLDRLRLDFNGSVTKLASTLAVLRGGIGSIDASANEMRSAVNALAKRTEQQAASLEETSAALQEITSRVQETTSRAAEAAKMANHAKSDTDKSSVVVSNAVKAMKGIEIASLEINNITNVIDEIAFQTNLLALNAGVEAARAGETGKGFAVVAQEVRELAQRAAAAAAEIKSLITKSGDQVTNGVALVNATGVALNEISNHVISIDVTLRNIASAAEEQLVGVREVNTSVNEMDRFTQQNAAMVEETNAITNRLADDAGELSRSIGQFQLDWVRSDDLAVA